MRFRRHLPPLHEWSLPGFDRQGAKRWGLAIGGALLAGYLTAFVVLFPAPLLHRHGVVPHVLGLSLADATTALRRDGFEVQDGGAQAHPTAPEGTVVWQDPPQGVSAPAGLGVTLVSSQGPSKIPVPNVTGIDGPLAQQLIAAAGLTVAQVESVQAAMPPGVTMLTRPPAATLVTPGTSVAVVVSRGAPTIAVPSLLGLSQADARTRLEVEGLVLGTVTRRRAGDAASGTVIAQKPAAGTLAAPGTVVDIVVARSL